MKKSFLTGIVVLFPLAITIAILAFIVNFLTSPFTQIVEDIVMSTNLQNYFSSHTIHLISQLGVLIGLFLGIVVLGILIQHFFFNLLLTWADKFFGRIPFISKVYKAMREITKTLMESKKKAFKQVVMVPYPNKEVHALGLLTAQSPNDNAEDLISVFVPTTPNPTSGYIVLFKKEQVIFLDMSVEEAIKYIVSCGVVANTSGSLKMKKKNKKRGNKQ